MSIIKKDSSLNINNRTNLLKYKLDINDALEVIEDHNDYTGYEPLMSPKPVPKEFENVYAIDFKLIWVQKRSESDPLSENRNKLFITDKDVQNYLDRNFKTNLDKDTNIRNKSPDTANSYLEYYKMVKDKDLNIYKYISADGKNNLDQLNKDLDTENIVQGVGRIIITNWSGLIIRDKYIEPTENVIWHHSSDIPYDFYNDLKGRSKFFELPVSYKSTIGDEVNYLFNLLYDGKRSPVIRNNSLIIGHNLINIAYTAMEINEYPTSRGDSKLPLILKCTRDTSNIFGCSYQDLNKTGDIIFLRDNLTVDLLLKGFLNRIAKSYIHTDTIDPSKRARSSLALYKLFREGIEEEFKLGTEDDLFYIHYYTKKEQDIIRKTNGDYLLEIFIKEIIRNLSINSNQILNNSTIDPMKNKSILLDLSKLFAHLTIT